MSLIRAVVVDPEAPDRLAFQDVAAPTPAPNEALVRLAALSLNRGEVRRVGMATAGWRPGWDVAGTVEQAADGSGPEVGARVVGLLPVAAWAELLAVPTESLAILPDEVSFAQAATLPVAGLTALYVLEQGGSLLDRNVLITGASGGVGQFAVQIARAAGARITAVVHQERHAAAAREMGAQRVIVSADGAAAAEFGPYDLIAESVGGATLGNVMAMVAPGGTCVTFGPTSGAQVTFDVSRFYMVGGTSLYGFILFHETRRRPAGAGLARLVRLVADGQLRTPIAVEASWKEIGTYARQLLERRYSGKAVLHVD
jgi:NADPH:quinone reductase-like Zn-dependent oxidoreductase